MNIYVKNHRAHYEILSVAGMFIKNHSFNVVFNETPQLWEENYIYSELSEGDELRISLVIKTSDYMLKKTETINSAENTESLRSQSKYIFSRLTYELLSIQYKKTMDWGILTGVRPVKLVTKRLTKGYTQKMIESDFLNKFLVTEKRTNLALEIAKKQMDIINRAGVNFFNLYISIPFCPTRCYYCSFISSEIEKNKELIPSYLEKLIKEIIYTATITKELGLGLRTIYIGGGTPTVLSHYDLDSIITTIKQSFSMEFLEEFTVEAGRPDTITKEKLMVFKKHGVDRISVNPQTLNDKTLKIIGRNHTVKDFFTAYNLAREIGFNTINTDIIAGLKGESFSDFKNTIEKLIKISPKNITVHTLSVKKASTLQENKEKYEKDDVRKMIDYSYKELEKKSYSPYYLYRQKNSRDNLENVGFERGESICRYNILMMEELESVIACGAGGVTKIVIDARNIFRIFNYKFPYEYIKDFDEIIKRKNEISKYY